MTPTPSHRTTRNHLTRRDALRRAGVAAAGAAALSLLRAGGAGSAHEGTPHAASPAAGTPAAGTPVGATPSAAGGREHVVEMTDQLHFVPHELTIKVGDTVTWTTVGAIPHTSTADPSKAQQPEEHVKLPAGAETWDSGIVNSGESWSRTFDVPGEYVYFCIPHEAAGMVASLTVTE